MNNENKIEQITDQVLAEQVTHLPDELTPQRDLWAGIERAIQNKPQLGADESISTDKKPYFVPATWAASIVAAVLVTWISFSPTDEVNSPLTAKNSDVSQQTKQPLVSDQLVAMIQENFSEQKQAMLVSFGQPDLKQLPAKMQEQLTQLAQARASIEKALKNDKNNVDLLNLLRFTQQQELNLLQQLLPYTGSNAPKWQTI